MTRIICPECDKMGRVTIVTADVKLTTTRCPNCNGEGVIEAHDTEGCALCAESAARKLDAAERLY